VSRFNLKATLVLGEIDVVLQSTTDLGSPVGCEEGDPRGGNDALESMAPMLGHGGGLGDKMVHVQDGSGHNAGVAKFRC
jgi:hypothetical protein